MKRYFYLSLVAVTVVLGGCQLFSKKELSTEFVQAERTLKNDTLDFKVNIRMELLVSGLEQTVIDSINAAILKPLLSVAQVTTPVQPMLEAYIDRTYSDYRLDIDETAKFPYEEKIDGVVTFQTDSLLSYSVQQYVYNGGAHGTTTTVYYTFDLQSGRRMDEAALFTPGYEAALTALLVDNLKKQADPANLADYDFSAVAPNNNIGIEPATLVYTFDPYAFAPYVYGTISIRIPFEELEPLLQKNTVVYHYLASGDEADE